jgi:hypothetical protein
LYGSTSSEGAAAELRFLLERQSIAITKPTRIVRLRARIARIIDLEAPEAVGVTIENLTGPSWTVPQHIAAAADWLGLAGLLVPSARHHDPNLVILVSRIGADDSIEVVDME